MARADSAVAIGLLVAIGIAIIGVSTFWKSARAESLLEGWARSGKFQILSREECWFFRGPFSWLPSKQVVFRVNIRDMQGRTLNGYVRLGSWWLGVWSDNIEVRWD